MVTADSTQTTPVTDDLDIPITQSPALTVDKSSATTSLAAPGTVTYSYLVKNTGNVTLTGVSLADDNDNNDMSCPATTLAPNDGTPGGADEMTCTATHTFTQAELDANGSPTAASGKLHNVVTADSTQTTPVTDDLDIPITQSPALTVDKSSATTSLAAPGTVTYSYLVKNTGNVTLTGVSLADDNDNQDMSCPATTLAPNDGTAGGADEMTCTATHTFTQAELDANGSPTAASGKLHNVVTADSTQTTPVTDDLDIPITQSPALTVDKSSATTSLAAPGTVTYSYLVKNTGNVTLTGVSLADDNDNNDMSCPATTLAPNDGTPGGADEMTCTATHTFTQAELDANGSPTAASGKLHNVVTADSTQTTPVTDDLDIPITQSPALTVDKSSATTSLAAPETVTYSYLVKNTGNVTLTGVSLADDNDNNDMSCPATTLAPNDGTPGGADEMTCTATHTFTQAELDANGSPTAASGKLHNVVTADSTQTTPVTDDLDIPITQSPALTVDKSSATTSLAAPGTVTYSYLVKNTGNVTLTGVSLADDNDNNDMSCPATTLAPNDGTPGGADEMTCTATHTFTQAELDANGSPTAASGKLHNVVTADSTQTTPVTDDLDIPITQTSGADG